MKKIKKVGTALITGSAKRIGRAIAIELASQGYDVVISYNNSVSDAKKLAQEISKNFSINCEIFKCDLRDEKQTKKLAQFMKKNFKDWNLLINNASIFKQSKFLTAPESELFDNLNIHFLAPLILSKEFAKNPAKNAQIINLVDKNISRFETSYFYYLLSKKFLAEFTKMLAVEIAPQVRVNAIAPGYILDPIDDSNPSKKMQAIIQKIPLKTKGEVENILQTLNFFLKNQFITGQVIGVDGGAGLNGAG